MSSARADRTQSRKSPKVYLIDFIPARAQELIGVLRDEGFDAVAFDNPRGMLGHLRREPPDAVIIEVILPTKSGFAIAAQMQADQRLSKIPIFFTTDIEDSNEVYEDYFSRPLNLKKMVEAIRKRIDG